MNIVFPTSARRALVGFAFPSPFQDNRGRIDIDFTSEKQQANRGQKKRPKIESSWAFLDFSFHPLGTRLLSPTIGEGAHEHLAQRWVNWI